MNMAAALLPKQFIVLDLETTGLKPGYDEIIEVGAIRVNRDSDHHDTFQSLVIPSRPIPTFITGLTGITDAMVAADGNQLSEVMEEFAEFVGNLRLVTYNASFDLGFLRASKSPLSAATGNPHSCALAMAQRAWPTFPNHKLQNVAGNLGIENDGAHRALGDCKMAMLVYIKACVALRCIR